MAASVRCAFLSTDDLDGYVVDDDRACAPLRARGVHVERVPWRAAARWDDYNIVVVRSTWDYQDDSAAFVDVLAAIDRSRAMLANPLAVLRWNLRKTYLARLEKRGVAIVPSVFGSALSARDCAALAARFAGRPWIIKPDVGANAGGVVRMPAQCDAASQRAAMAQLAGRGWVAQPFVDDVTARGEVSLFYFDGGLSHAVLKTPRSGDFRVQEEHGGRIVPIRANPRERALADAVLRCLPAPCLYARVDMVRLEGGAPAVMEVELIEPSMYLRTDASAPGRFADAIVAWLARERARRGPGTRSASRHVPRNRSQSDPR